MMQYDYTIYLLQTTMTKSTTRTKKISVNSKHVNPCSQTLTPGKRSKTRNRSKNTARLKTPGPVSYFCGVFDSHFPVMFP